MLELALDCAFLLVKRVLKAFVVFFSGKFKVREMMVEEMAT